MNRYMKQKATIILTVLLLAVSTAFGQIIFTEEDHDPNTRASGSFGVMVPMQNTNVDQYSLSIVPLGGGIVLLSALGGAYLLQRVTEK